MKKCTFHFILTLAVTSLLILFLAFQNLDHPIIKKEQTLAFEQLLHSNPSASIPSTVIYSTRFDVHKNCSSIPDPNKTIHIAQRDTWQLLMRDEASSLLLYSAHRDQRLADCDYLRFLGMSEGRFADRVFCRIWFDEDGGQAVVEADYHELWVSKWDSAPPGEYFRPLLLSCSYPKGVTPVAASLVPEPCVEPSNLFFFDVKPPDPKDVKNFVVCLKPLDFAQKDVTPRLLEWLELQFILGADDVAVYTLRDHPPHPRVSEVLAGYAKSGRVTIKRHVFPSGEDNGGLWQKRRHEMLVYNDCFYRHVHTHRWVVNLDLDEAIVPQQDDTWMKLLDRVAKRDPRALKAASISAPNVYFFDQFGVDPSDDVPKYFHMLKHLFRSSNFTPAGFAQKSFCSTLLTQSVTHHYPLRGLHPFLRLSVPGGRDLLRLHHYRASCPTGMASECEANYMRYLERDRGILRFKEPLVSNVQKRIKELNVSIS